MIQESEIKQQILNLIDSVNNSDISRDQAREIFAESLTQIITDALKSITITFVPGDIKVIGSQTTQQNLTTLTLNNRIS